MHTLLSAEEVRDQMEKIKIRLKLEEDTNELTELLQIEMQTANALMDEAWAKGQIPSHLRAIARLINQEMNNPLQSNNVIFYTICKGGQKEYVLLGMLCRELKDKGYIVECDFLDEYYQFEISW